MARVILSVSIMLNLLLAPGTREGAHAQTAKFQTILTDVARETPECVSWGEGRIDCVIRRKSGALTWIAHFEGRWQAPRELGGDFSGQPSCVVRGPFGLNCFAPSAKGHIGHIFLNGPLWSAWSNLGGRAAAQRPTCVSNGRDRLACLIRGQDGALWHKAWFGAESWDAWRPLGGKIQGAASCLPLPLDRFACLGRNTQGGLTLWAPAKTGPSLSIQDLGGQFSGAPSCVKSQSGQMICLVRAYDGKLTSWQGALDTLSAAQNGFERLAIDAKDDPICGAGPSGPVCSVQDASGALMVLRQVHGQWSAAHPLPEPALSAHRCLHAGTRLACFLTDAERRLQATWADHAWGPVTEDAAHAPMVGIEGDQAAAPQMQVKPETESALQAAATGPHAASIGEWLVLSEGSGLACRIVLTPGETTGEGTIALKDQCGAPGLIRLIARWRHSEGVLLGLTAKGQLRLRFAAEGEDQWRAVSRNGAAYVLVRRTEQVSALVQQHVRSTLGGAGAWRLSQGPVALCSVRANLNAEMAGARPGGAIEGAQSCAGALASLQGWALDGGVLILSDSGGNALARLGRLKPGLWRGRILGRRGPLTIAIAP